MKTIINILVIDDNEFFNNLLSTTLQQSVSSIILKGKHQLVLRSFTDANEFIKRIKSKELELSDTVIFMDYYLGNGINAGHIIRLLNENSCDKMIILLSQSKAVKQKNNLPQHDYFVVKDDLAPALCSLYLRQFIENKYSVSFD